METLSKLQKWYEAQCDGDWEHHYGVNIDTLDNPGWLVSIDVIGTNLEEKSFEEIKDLPEENSWIHCSVANKRFRGAGDPQRLEEILEIFLAWAYE